MSTKISAPNAMLRACVPQCAEHRPAYAFGNARTDVTNGLTHDHSPWIDFSPNVSRTKKAVSPSGSGVAS